jgi:CheY-like chemotaxis protein
MKILIAEDDPFSRTMLSTLLERSGYEVIMAEDGEQAWSHLEADQAPRLAILDYAMPGMTGPQVCRKVRERGDGQYAYLILLTARDRKEDVVEGLEAGADDYVTKPFDSRELRSRIRAGERIVELKSSLEEKVHALESALAHVHQLEGLLPICMHCKRIRDQRDTWQVLEHYIQEHSTATFTHSLCAECREKFYPEESLTRKRVA